MYDILKGKYGICLMEGERYRRCREVSVELMMREEEERKWVGERGYLSPRKLELWR